MHENSHSGINSYDLGVRHLCIDLGDKRTGLAVGDTVTRLVSAHKTLEVPVSSNAGESLIAALAAECKDVNAGVVVVGLPLNMDGTEGPRAKIVRDLARRVAERAALPVHFQDERLTSAAADWQMARSGLTHGQKKSRRDALAAAEILRDYFKSTLGPESCSESPE